MSKNRLNTTILSRSQYLSAANGDAERAFEALLRDAQSLADEAADLEPDGSIRARAITKALNPLLDFLGIDVDSIIRPGARPSEDSVAALTAEVEGVMDSITDLSDSRDTWMEIAAEAGLDVEAMAKAESQEKLEEILGGWYEQLDSASNPEAEQELAIYRFAYANGLNPEALKLQKGLDGLALVDVEVEKDGKKVTEKVWSVPTAKEGEYVPALDHLEPVMAALKPSATTPTGVSWIKGQEAKPAAASGKSGYEQYLKSREQQQAKATADADPLQPQAVASVAPGATTTATKGV